jgi:proline racemase
VEHHGQKLQLDRVAALTDYSVRVRQAVNRQGFPEVDHIELFGPPTLPGAHSRNFVLCPGQAYDRSPCGTGTSAKLACLADDGVLAPGSDWVQESVIGSRFTASYRNGEQGQIVPSITGRAFICAETTLVRQPGDPFAGGIA